MATNEYKISYLPQFDRDILQISEALAEHPNKAQRLFIEMEHKLNKLVYLPFMWPVYHAKPEYRLMVLEDHLLFYIVDEAKNEVQIFRVLYNKMDIQRHLD
jgi:plasmid stabilization system protein ParE